MSEARKQVNVNSFDWKGMYIRPFAELAMIEHSRWKLNKRNTELQVMLKTLFQGMQIAFPKEQKPLTDLHDYIMEGKTPPPIPVKAAKEQKKAKKEVIQKMQPKDDPAPRAITDDEVKTFADPSLSSLKLELMLDELMKDAILSDKYTIAQHIVGRLYPTSYYQASKKISTYKVLEFLHQKNQENAAN